MATHTLHDAMRTITTEADCTRMMRLLETLVHDTGTCLIARSLGHM